MKDKNKFSALWLLVVVLVGWPVAKSRGQTNPPALQIISSNAVATVLWTNHFDTNLVSSSGYYLLQSAGDLSLTAAWTNEVGGDLSVVINSFPATGGSATLTTNLVGGNFAFPIFTTSEQKFYRLRTPPPIPLCCFDIFYNGALEFSLAPPTTRLGRVHANGPVYVGSAASHYFNKTVSTTSTISSIAVDGQTSYGMSSTFFLGSPATLTNGPALMLFVSTLTNNAHVLIDIPPAAENPMSSLGQERFYNKAQMVLLVTNDSTGFNTNPTVTLLLRTSVNGAVPGNDPTAANYTITNASPDTLAGSFPFLTLTNNFYDRREQKTNIVTDFDVGIFANWAATNEQVQTKLPASASIFPNILFVADRRTKTGYQNGQLAVVRVRNGSQLPFNNGSGFTLATPNPLYVLGNYNIQISGSTNLSVSTTNTAYTIPAALISDALTVLSSNWSDAHSPTAYSQGDSAYFTRDTTINAAIITGTMPSTGTSDTTFSGNVQNLPRLLQNWANTSSGVANLWLNTSIIRLWTSQMATNQFRNPSGFSPTPVNPYYNAPSRHFNFDTNFLNPAKMPPGIPSVSFNWPTNQ